VALKFLFDECTALPLVQLAHEKGFEAYHVAHRGLAGQEDHELLPVLLENDFVLVTNNGRDFESLLGGEDAVHPGLVILMTQVRPSVQVTLFRAVLDHLRARADLVNRVVEVDLDEATKALLTPNEALSEESWKRVESEARPVLVEKDLPDRT
jgi:predicted nuclease of predicted toxin-antitoxin system